MNYNTQTRIVIINNFNGPMNIILKHQYSDDSLFSNRWLNVLPGAQSVPSWTVGYNTGFAQFGQDYWFIQAEVQSSEQAGVWQTDMFLCTLHEEDANQTLRFTVGSNGLLIEKPSGDSQQTLAKIA
jgi:hypothetical protein